MFYFASERVYTETYIEDGVKIVLCKSNDFLTFWIPVHENIFKRSHEFFRVLFT